MSITFVLVILAATLMGADITKMELKPQCDVTHLAEQDTTYHGKTCCDKREPDSPLNRNIQTTITGVTP